MNPVEIEKIKLTNIHEGLTSDYVLTHKPKAKRHHQKVKLIFEVLKNQVTSIFFVLLLVSTILSYYLGNYVDSIIFLSINLVNVLFGFFQEYKASRASQLLETLIRHSVSVLRDGKIITISSQDAIVGDIILLIPGDVVSGDILVREGHDIFIDESVLTGESLPIKKNKGDILSAGTNVVAGKVTGQVISSSENNSLTQYSKSLESVQKHNSFSQFVSRVSLSILLVTLVSLFLIVITSVLYVGKYSISEFTLFSISMLIGVVPESLPLIITLMLSREALALSRDGVLVKRLSALQQLGSMRYLLTDKTGTITENKLNVADVYDVSNLRECAAIISQSQYEKNPMDQSLDFAVNNYCEKNPAYESYKPNISPFTNSLGYGMFLFPRARGAESLVIIRGQYKAIISVCQDISPEARAELDKKYIDFESKGLRVIAYASRVVPTGTDVQYEHTRRSSGYCLSGFIVLEDPLKSEAHHSYKAMEGLGVSVKIITGDSPLVAGYIAHKLDPSFDGDTVCSLDDVGVQSLTETDIDKKLVYARCKPDQKLELINRHLLKDSVGFMGEGINDALALKKADVGVVVNNASDVARQSADLILTEKSLNPIIKAVQMSRRVYSHITTYLLCTLTGNIGTLFSLTAVALFWTDLPMLPVQILLNNLLTDVPLLLLITDHVSKLEAAKPIRQTAMSFFKKMVLFGLVSSIFDMIYFFTARGGDLDELRTGWFVFSVICELILVLSLRSKEFAWKAPKISLPLKAALILCSAIAIAFIYTPSISTIFSLVPLGATQIGVIFALALIYFGVNEACKIFIHRHEDKMLLKKNVVVLQGGKISLYAVFFLFIVAAVGVVGTATKLILDEEAAMRAGATSTGSTTLVDKAVANQSVVATTSSRSMTKRIKTQRVKIGSHTFTLEVADTFALRELGLGVRKQMGQYDGMIFVFDKPDRYGFWMKDTFFGLDLLWIDENLKIVSKEERVLPESYPKVFYPTSKSLYTIELSAGTLEKLQIKIGDPIFFLE